MCLDALSGITWSLEAGSLPLRFHGGIESTGGISQPLDDQQQADFQDFLRRVLCHLYINKLPDKAVAAVLEDIRQSHDWHTAAALPTQVNSWISRSKAAYMEERQVRPFYIEED